MNNKKYVYALLCEGKNISPLGDDGRLLIDVYHDEDECRKRLRKCVEERTAEWGRHFGYNPDDKGCKVDPMTEGELPDGWQVLISERDRYQLARVSDNEYYYYIWIEKRKII